MKIKADASLVRGLLQSVLKLGTGDITHPGFNLLHLEVTARGALRATVVNSQAAVRQVVVPGDAKAEPGAVALPLAKAAILARVLPDQGQVTLSATDDKPVLLAKTRDMALREATRPVADLVPFPSPPGGGDGAWADVRVSDLRDVIRAVAWAVADVRDPRVALQGLHFAAGYAEASDGYRMAQLRRPVLAVPCVLTVASVVAAADLAGKADTVKIQVTGNRLWCQGPSFIVTCRTVDGTYPDTSAIYLPDEGLTAMALTMAQAPVSRARVSGLLTAAQNVSEVFSGPDRPVMKFANADDAGITAQAHGQDGTQVDIAYRLGWKPETGADAQGLQALLLDARYVARAVSALPDADELRLTWLGARDRIQVAAGDVRVVIMPREK